MRKVYSDQTMEDVQTRASENQSAEKINLFDQINYYIYEANNSRSEWKDKLEKFYKLRMRVKKKKTFPFKGASNIRMPTAEKNIRKIKAGVMGIIFGARPIVSVQPSPSTTIDRAQKIEKFVDHLVMNVIKIEPKAEIGIDQSLEKGFAFLKPYWRREIVEREESFNIGEMPLAEAMSIFFMNREELIPLIIQRFDVDQHDAVFDDNMVSISDTLDDIVENGTLDVTFMVKDVVYDFPDVDYISPERVYAPVDSGYDVQCSTMVTHELFLPLHQIQRDADYKGYDIEAVNQLTAMRNINLEDNAIEFDKDTREGIERMKNPSSLVRVWESYGWFDINGDGKLVKSFVTSFPDFKLVARAIKINNLSGRYPIVKLFYELTDDRWFAHRGVPELLEDIIKEIDVQHNMKIDSQTIRNAPMFLYRSGMINPNLVKMIPNQAIPVNGLQSIDDTIKVLNMHNPNVEFSYEREQQLLNLEVQETVGQVDFSLQSVINRRQPRTLGEVEQQVASTGQVFSMDARHYINSFSELFNDILELWSQFGPDEYEFLYFGNSEKGEKIKLTKEEIQNKYQISVRGNDQTLNPNVRIQKAQQILLAAKDPLLLQLGIIGPQQIANSLRRFYQALDVENPDDLINLQPQPQQADPSLEIVPKIFDEMTEDEQAQFLQKLGIKPDAQNRSRRAFSETMESAADIANKVG